MAISSEARTIIAAKTSENKSLLREIKTLRATNEKLVASKEKLEKKIKPKKTHPPSAHSIRIGEIMMRPEVQALKSSTARMVEANRINREEKVSGEAIMKTDVDAKA